MACVLAARQVHGLQSFPRSRSDVSRSSPELTQNTFRALRVVLDDGDDGDDGDDDDDAADVDHYDDGDVDCGHRLAGHACVSARACVLCIFRSACFCFCARVGGKMRWPAKARVGESFSADEPPRPTFSESQRRAGRGRCCVQTAGRSVGRQRDS